MTNKYFLMIILIHLQEDLDYDLSSSDDDDDEDDDDESDLLIKNIRRIIIFCR
jgi:hypothetical protein